MNLKHNIIIIGAGPSGIGIAIALKMLGLDSTIIDAREVGASFKKWPKQMRMISPSFPSNQFGLLDLNAIAPNTSPALFCKAEHPSGVSYAKYLEALVSEYELNVQIGTHVKAIRKLKRNFEIEIVHNGETEVLRAKYVIWAAGEFFYPKMNVFSGSALCTHNSTISDWDIFLKEEKKEKEGNKKNHIKTSESSQIVIIGGGESAVDSAYNCVIRKKKCRIITPHNILDPNETDPSCTLSPYSVERFRTILDSGLCDILQDSVIGVSKANSQYTIKLASGASVQTTHVPILATGFLGSQHMLSEIAMREDGFPELSIVDETTLQNLFICGPMVRHYDMIFCFIYKYRQRFGVVADEIAKRCKIAKQTRADFAALYKKHGLFLDDLSCCQNCNC
jgi:putative flavoprotein involved in K+ transport